MFRRLRASSKATLATRRISGGGVDLRVDAATLAVTEILDSPWFSEVNAAGQLANNHDIEARYDLRLQAGSLHQRFEAKRRAEVGVKLHLLAQTQKTSLRLPLKGDLIPLRPANRAKKHGVDVHRLVHGCIGERHAVLVDRGAAHKIFAHIEGYGAPTVHPLDHSAHLSHDLGADTVTGQYEQGLVRGHGLSSPEVQFYLAALAIPI